MFPDTFETARLTAERLLPEHRTEIHRMHQDARQMALLGGVRDDAKTDAYMEYNLGHWAQYNFGLWIMRDNGDGAVAGRGMLRHVLLDGEDEVEVGYSLYPAFWGRGLATEIAAACLELARSELRLASVVALTRPEHTRSRRVMTKAGMVFERDILQAGVPHVVFRARLETLASPP
jgi:RimJ/RimL family protein N-acetyltransferase